MFCTRSGMLAKKVSKTTRMDISTIQYYDSQGAEIAKRYEAVESPVSQYFSHAFLPGSKVLEIGIGSGRDLACLLANGFDVLGVEPSSTLRDCAVHFHPELAGKVLEGALPELNLSKAVFDAVLCSAVLMHVPSSLLFDSALKIRDCLKANGRLLLSLPLERGDTNDTNRDQHGRLFSPYTPDQIETLFTRLGFVLISRWDTDDSLSRTSTSWFTQLYEYRAHTDVRPLDQIEAVLNRDRKEATYKLALFRALAEIAQVNERSAVWLTNSRVGIPLALLANCWMRYYWPIVASPEFIPQSNAEGGNGKCMKFRAALRNLIDDYKDQGAHGGLTAWYLERLSNTKRPSTMLKQVKALKAIADTIVAGPVAYAGGSLEGGAIFEYDTVSKQVLVPATLWRELVLMGHWISEAVILRWASLTAKFGASKGVGIEQVLPLLVVSLEPERATNPARKAFEKAGLNRCTWTNKKLSKGFVVDHAIPFSLWGNNDLWNLLQSDPKVNLNKSDKLPTIELLEERRIAIFEDWDILREELPTVFDSQASAFVGSSVVSVNVDWKTELFRIFKQSIEITAIQRGVSRWHGIN